MKRIALFVAVCVVVGAAGAQENPSFGVSPRFWGATVNLRYDFATPTPGSLETALLAGVSAAYETSTYVRLGDGSPAEALSPAYVAGSESYNRLDAVWTLGVEQGVVAGNAGARDLLVAFALYRGQYDLPRNHDTTLFGESGLPEADGSLLGALIAGIGLDGVTTGGTSAARSGVAAEASVEWGPSFLHNQVLGAADYGRLNLTGKLFAPIFMREERGSRRISLYQATMASIDYGFGEQLPFQARSTFGGRSPRSGLGGAVRGYTSKRYDADLKAVFNTELRLNGPSLLLSSLVPGLLVHYDAGYFVDTRGVSATPDDGSGFVHSAGAGAYLEIGGAAQIIFYTHVLLSEESLDGRRWVPFGLGFGFHI